MTDIMMTVLTVAITFLIAVLSGLGVGSAGLLVLFLTLVQHQPQLAAQGLNLFFFLFSSGAALLVHLFRTPPLFGCSLLLIPTGILGALLGFRLAVALPEELLRKLFGGLLIVSGAIGLFKKNRSSS